MKKSTRKRYGKGKRVSLATGGASPTEELFKPKNKSGDDTVTGGPAGEGVPFNPKDQGNPRDDFIFADGKGRANKNPADETGNTDGETNQGGNNRIIWWQQKGYNSRAEAIADGWVFVTGKGWVQNPSENDNGEETPYVPTKGATDPNRTARVQATGQQAEQIAAGDFSSTDLPTIPDAQTLIDPETGLPAKSTELDPASEAFKMQQTKAAEAAGVAGVSEEQVAQGTTDTADATEVKGPSTIKDVATVADKDVAVDAAEGTVTQGPIEDIQGEVTAGVKFATVDAVKAEAAKAKNVEDVLSGTYLVDEVEGEDTTVAATPDAEKQERETILGEAAPDGVAAQITDTVGYEAAKQRPVKGVAAQGAAATMIAETADIPEDIAAAIVEDPATMTAQLDTDPDPVVNAAIAALPQEALVSAQMESLLGGMEDGKIPLWAGPAVAAVNQGMAARGLSVSTVGRDSLFNAIIQSAMPMAQGNAQALQARAAQNLSNQQQANLQQAQQTQQIRMQNLANRQDAASQTAQMSQQMKVMQSQFNQEAGMKSADQQQQTAMANLQNQQQAAVINAQNEQQIAVQNLGNEQQMAVANLQVEAAQEGANQAAENQEKLAEMQVAADFLSKNAAFKQQMEVANLSNEQQMRLANLSSRNLAASENMSNAEKTELANLNKTMQTNQLQAQIASQMGLAQLNVDQQSAIQNANTKANMDLTKFNAAQQTELANSKFMQTVALTDMNAEQQAIMQNATAMASMDLANLSTRERLAVENAKNFLTMDMANLNNEQQANIMKAQQEQQRLLSDQSAQNAVKQFNATSENQLNQFMSNLAQTNKHFNTSQINSMTQFNTQALNAAEARRAGREAEAVKLEAQLKTDISKFNSQLDFQREEFNSKNETAIAQSNVAWRRQANTIDTAAQNSINQQNAQNAFGLTASAMNFLWQELRDEADFNFRRWDNEETRKTSIYTAALGNDTGAASDSNWSSNLTAISTLINGWLN